MRFIIDISLGLWIPRHSRSLYTRSNRRVEACHRCCARKGWLHLLPDLARWQGKLLRTSRWQANSQLFGYPSEGECCRRNRIRCRPTKTHDRRGNPRSCERFWRSSQEVYRGWLRRSRNSWVGSRRGLYFDWKLTVDSQRERISSRAIPPRQRQQANRCIWWINREQMQISS